MGRSLNKQAGRSVLLVGCLGFVVAFAISVVLFWVGVLGVSMLGFNCLG